MSKKKSLLMSILMVLVIGLIITGSSFAYFQWSLGYASGTGVNVTIEHGGVTMHIESETKEFVGLYPTKIDDASDCDRTRYGDALVTIVNKTGTMAIPSFKLKVKVTKGGSDTLTKKALEHIRYTVVPITTTVDAQGKPVKGTETSNCSAGVTGSAATGNKYDVETNWSTFGMKFESVSTSSAWSHIPATNDYVLGGDNKINSGYLPRQYNTTTGNVEGITFKAPQYATTYQYFRVYVWIDEGYTTTIIGNIVTDPLQNAKIEIAWSENSMVEQVVGSGTASDYPNSVPIENVGGNGNTGEATLNSGLYDGNGQLVSTWDELVASGDIVVAGTRIISSFNSEEDEENNEGLSGVLIIPNEITEITEEAFHHTSLTSITLPASVISIGNYAFIESDVLYTINYKGTISQWNAIGKGQAWNGGVPATYVECLDGNVSLLDAGLYDGEGNYTTWDELLEGNDGDSSYITVNNTSISSFDDSLFGILVIPEGITNISGYVFEMSQLSEIIIPASVTSLGINSFSDSGIGNIIFVGNSQLTTIGNEAFAYTNLTSIEIPASVTSIGNYAFADCEELSTIEFKGTIAQWNAITKGENWNSNVPATKVICSDGEVSLTS